MSVHCRGTPRCGCHEGKRLLPCAVWTWNFYQLVKQRKLFEASSEADWSEVSHQQLLLAVHQSSLRCVWLCVDVDATHVPDPEPSRYFELSIDECVVATPFVQLLRVPAQGLGPKRAVLHHETVPRHVGPLNQLHALDADPEINAERVCVCGGEARGGTYSQSEPRTLFCILCLYCWRATCIVIEL